MKSIIVFLSLLLVSNSTFALQCESVFLRKNESEFNRPLLNSLKRIRNFATFFNIIMVNQKTNRMTLIVFDIFNDGVIGERKSLEDHVLELRSFASEMRFVYDSQTKDQLLVSRLAKTPESQRQENLLSTKFENGISLLENLKNSKSAQQSYSYEIFQSVASWLSKPGVNLNVLILPENQRLPFIEMAANHGDFRFHTLEEIIHKIDPDSI